MTEKELEEEMEQEANLCKCGSYHVVRKYFEDADVEFKECKECGRLFWD